MERLERKRGRTVVEVIWHEKDRFMEPVRDIHRELESLEARIAAKRAEFAAQGALHGPEREAAAELDMARESLRRRMEQARTGDGDVGEALAGDLDVLKHLFEQWLARTDRRSEGL